MITSGITALRMAPKIAKNIKNILGKEEVVKLSPRQKNRKTYRMDTELSSDTDIAAIEKQYAHLNFKLNPIDNMRITIADNLVIKNKKYPI